MLTLPLDEQREALWPGYLRTYAALGNDWDLNTAAMADDYEFNVGGSRQLPGLETWHGRDEYIGEQKKLLEHLDVDRVELDDLIPLGGGRVVALIRFVLRSGDSTIDQQCLDYHQFRDGQLWRQTIWFDREEGKRELGL